ncbi:hypothetical protein U9M48_043670 [Paspalum notatum var. saurae]|uniref:BED-type domain-containing protein n=1 Tax=Paspalum notatum var. saurae TaxID=547442 RepID=A0AAQ3XHK7_PASNO
MADSQAPLPSLRRSPAAAPVPTPSRLWPIAAPTPPPSGRPPVVRNGSKTVAGRSPPQPSPDGFSASRIAGPRATRAVSQPQPSTMSPDPALIRTAEAAHTVLMDTPPSDGGPSGGSPRTPTVEVLMPMPSSTTAKRARVLRTKSPTIDQTKRARCAVGSPSLRIINQIQMSTQRRSSPRSTTAQKSRGTRSRNASRQLRSVHWKEFEPIIEDGEIVHAKCVHCHDYLIGKQGIGTSHIKKHLEQCKLRAKLTDLVDKMHAGGKPADIDLLDNWVYGSDMARRALVRMIVLHEFPFSIVEYKRFVSSFNPLFKMVSRTTIKLDCMRTFEGAKLELRELFKNSSSRVSLTTDMWTSNQTLGYLCVTCHWISNAWKMEKRIIKFVMMESPHNAQSMFNVILKGIQEWNIEDNLFSITLDNAKVNNSMMELMRGNLLLKKMLPCDGNIFHLRYAAHVINLVVQYGLRQISSIVNNIRESVKYIKSSQARREKFEEIAVQMGISLEKQPSLDVPTRWNSTFLMLQSAYPFRTVFDELAKQDPNFNTAPSLDEWERSRGVCNFLKTFYDATVVLSGSSYPTTHHYFHQLWKIKLAMDKETSSEDQDIAAMVKQMQKKFMQYWEITYLSFSIPIILDPRFKYSFVDFRLNQFFGRNAIPKLDRVMSTLKKLFSEYSQTNHSDAELAHETRYAEVNTLKDDSFDDWDQHRSAQQRTQSSNELNAYLAEIAIPRTDEFDILAWWKSNCTTYPILSRMACDVLSTPASIVPSESAFSTGQRVVSDFWSRLNPSTVEALICFQDWMRAVGL